MIPSRPLRLVEIISETFSIYGRSVVRYSLLFLILFVPGTILMTSGVIGLAHDTVASAERSIGFNDSALTTLRNDMSGWMASQNPFYSPEWPVRDTSGWPHASTLAFAHFARTHITEFSGSMNLLIFGALLAILGLFALVGASIDLAAQVFEERPLAVWEALRMSVTRHAWRILFLYLLIVVINLLVEQFLLAMPVQIGGAFAGIYLGVLFFLFLRLVVTMPALVSEELGPFAAIRRSWELTRARLTPPTGATFPTPKILLSLLAFGILFFLVYFVVGVILIVLSAAGLNGLNEFLTLPHLTIQWFQNSMPPLVETAVIDMTVAVLVLLPLVPVFLTVLYYDLRTRHDGPLVYVD